MRYFVTGGTGFIGSHLVRQLLAEDHEVVAFVRDPERARDLEASGAELARGDLTDRNTLRAPMAGVDGVFHVAAWYAIGSDGSRAEAINVDGTRNVLETMHALGIEKGVYTSTLAVNFDTYGEHVDESYRYDGPHLSVYSETKWRAHYEVAVPLVERGLSLVIVMPGVVYGPGDTSQLGALLRDAAGGKFVVLPGGEAGVCWAHVDDIVRGHMLAMERGRSGETYIIAGPCRTFRTGFETAARAAGRPLRAVWMPPAILKGMSRIMAVLEKILPVPPDYTSEALRIVGGTTYYGDQSKAQRELGYAPRSLEEGMRDMFSENAESLGTLSSDGDSVFGG